VVAAAGAVLLGGDEETTESSAAEGAIVEGEGMLINSSPAGAGLVINGKYLAETPYRFKEGTPGKTYSLRFELPGYLPAESSVECDPNVGVNEPLTPVKGFEGTWRVAGGHLRKLVRKKDMVIGYPLAHVGDEARDDPRFFTFKKSDDPEWTVFGTSAVERFERAPNEESCIVRLESLYRYHHKEMRLELQMETADVHYSESTGTCEFEKGWKPWAPATRAEEGATPTVSEMRSRAWSSRIKMVDPDITAQALLNEEGTLQDLAKNAIPDVKQKSPRVKKRPKKAPNKARVDKQKLLDDKKRKLNVKPSNIDKLGKEPTQKSAPPIKQGKKPPPVKQGKKAPPPVKQGKLRKGKRPPDVQQQQSKEPPAQQQAPRPRL
jgi:hypothetical protein